MRKILAVGLGAAFIGAGTFALAQTQQTQAVPEALIGPRPAAQATADQQPRISQLRSLRGAGQIHVDRLQPDVLRRSQTGQNVLFQVTPERSIAARTLTVEWRDGATVWRGEIAGQGQQPPGLATLVITNAGVTGTIHASDGRTYRLRPLPGGDTAVIEINYETLPEDESPAFIRGGQAQLRAPRLIAPGAAGETQRVRVRPQVRAQAPGAVLNDTEVARRLANNRELLQLATQPSAISLVERYRVRVDIGSILRIPTINVLVAYTPAAQTASGDISGLINLAIEETNGSFVNSNVWARVRLAGTMAVSYNETTRDYDTIIGHFATNGDGQMDNVHAQRDALNADVVVLIINQGDWCGQARAIGANASQAFAIVHWDCATGYYSFGHEVAHLVGARHDEPTDTTDTPYAFGHGFRHQAASPNGWRTIMAYRCGDGSCNPRLQYWSTPLTSWSGIPMGRATDADNRRAWNEGVAAVAAFR